MSTPMEVPLTEQLRSVPKDGRDKVWSDPATYRNIPYGSLCHQAADRIDILEARIRELENANPNRAIFAGQALAGLLANPGGPIQHNPMRAWDLTNCTWDDVAGVAITAADALIKALEEKR